jgi:hypothetical protein
MTIFNGSTNQHGRYRFDNRHGHPACVLVISKKVLLKFNLTLLENKQTGYPANRQVIVQIIFLIAGRKLEISELGIGSGQIMDVVAALHHPSWKQAVNVAKGIDGYIRVKSTIIHLPYGTNGFIRMDVGHQD